MRLLRYAAFVTLIVWVGGLIALGAVVAPVVDLARLGEVVDRFHLVAYGAGAVLLLSLLARRLLGPKPVHFGVRTGILCAMLALTVYSDLALGGDLEGRRMLWAGIVVATAAAGLALVGFEAAEG
jgi:hypothetical protein